MRSKFCACNLLVRSSFFVLRCPTLPAKERRTKNEEPRTRNQERRTNTVADSIGFLWPADCSWRLVTDTQLRELARLYAIQLTYEDAWGRTRKATPEQLRTILRARIPDGM